MQVEGSRKEPLMERQGWNTPKRKERRKMAVYQETRPACTEFSRGEPRLTSPVAAGITCPGSCTTSISGFLNAEWNRKAYSVVQSLQYDDRRRTEVLIFPQDRSTA